MRSHGGIPALLVVAALAVARAGPAQPAADPVDPARVPPGCPPELAPIRHLVVLCLENRSFDCLYGEFPGADGLANARATAVQVDSTGRPYRTLPRYPNQAYPKDLPNGPFPIERYVRPDVETPDLTHRFYQEIGQIDGGKMDRFALLNDMSKGLSLGYYHTRNLPLAALARQYTLCDRFFHAAFGGSFLNHQWLVAAATPRLEGPSRVLPALVDAHGRVVADGALTPDGYLVNNAFSVQMPHPVRAIPADQLVPPFTNPTIGDRLSAAGVSWAWYSGGWDSAAAGRPDSLFQFHHQPLAYYASFGDTTRARAEHLRDERDFLAALGRGALPAVAFVKPGGRENEHPNYADLVVSERYAVDLVRRIMRTRDWAHTAIVVTYDENGGFWDHVPPPKGDRWGPGTRVPALVIAPFARRRHVDHHLYDTTSILALIEHRWGLAPLSARDAHADDLRHAFATPAARGAAPARRR